MPMRKTTILLNISHDGEFQDIAMTVTNDLIPKVPQLIRLCNLQHLIGLRKFLKTDLLNIL